MNANVNQTNSLQKSSSGPCPGSNDSIYLDEDIEKTIDLVAVEIKDSLDDEEKTRKTRKAMDDKFKRYTCCIYIQISLGIKLIAMFIILDEINQLYNIYVWTQADTK